jgi:hypothetical protein
MQAFIPVLMMLALLVLESCSYQNLKPMEFKPALGDGIENAGEGKRDQAARNPKNWKKLDVPIEGVVFCSSDKPNYLSEEGRCVPDKEYRITKYLPKRVFEYRWFVIFTDDEGKDNLFLLDSLPRKSDRERILQHLEEVDP